MAKCGSQPICRYINSIVKQHQPINKKQQQHHHHHHHRHHRNCCYIFVGKYIFRSGKVMHLPNGFWSAIMKCVRLLKTQMAIAKGWEIYRGRERQRKYQIPSKWNKTNFVVSVCKCELLISNEREKKITQTHRWYLTFAHRISNTFLCSFIAPSFASLLLLLYLHVYV